MPADVVKIKPVDRSFNFLHMNYGRCVKAVMHYILFSDFPGHHWCEVSEAGDAYGIVNVMRDEVGILSKVPHDEFKCRDTMRLDRTSGFAFTVGFHFMAAFVDSVVSVKKNKESVRCPSKDESKRDENEIVHGC